MQQSDRERFEALIAAKRAKGDSGRPGHADDRRGGKRRSPTAAKPFRRKV